MILKGEALSNDCISLNNGLHHMLQFFFNTLHVFCRLKSSFKGAVLVLSVFSPDSSVSTIRREDHGEADYQRRTSYINK